MAKREMLLANLAALFSLVIVCLGPVEALAESRCVCRFAGQTYLVGKCVCMNRAKGAERACCGKVLNNTSWLFTGDGCPIAMGEPPAQTKGSAVVRDQFDMAPKIAPTQQRAVLSQ